MCNYNFHKGFSTSRRLLAITRDCLLVHNYGSLRQCFAIAERRLREGTSEERMAIANDFMFSVTNLIDQLGRERKLVLVLLPPLLQREYLSQINALSV